MVGTWKPMTKEIDGELDLNIDAKTIHFFAEVKMN